ncbi:class I SAM-dependent methyltransferase [Streptomyces sp. NPDC050485]|uniref:class I SAM-dependent methyltransferase n=1 Tax=Streptomyces sp. NPDC050485 TaxID=3365617 RepID=UPI003790702E
MLAVRPKHVKGGGHGVQSGPERADAPDLGTRCAALRRLDAPLRPAHLRDGRQWIGAQADGGVLEVAVGTGLNLPHYPHCTDLTGIDLSPAMLERARRRADDLGVEITLIEASATQLPFPDASFDTAVCVLALCRIPDDRAARRQDAPGPEARRGLRLHRPHTGDAHYGTGIAHGDDIHEHGGFAVHFFPRGLVEELADGWDLVDIHPFEEGELPRRLWRVTQILPA